MNKSLLSSSKFGLLLRGIRRLHRDSRGQVLPLAMAALALGALLVSPFLVDASVNLLASRRVDASIKDYYSADAGVEWALWRLEGDPALTDSTDWVEPPLQPTPPALNGSPFPTTEVRRVPDAGLSQTDHARLAIRRRREMLRLHLLRVGGDIRDSRSGGRQRVDDSPPWLGRLPEAAGPEPDGRHVAVRGPVL